MLPGASSASPPPRFPFRLLSSPITVKLVHPVLIPPSPIATRSSTYFYIDWPTFCMQYIFTLPLISPPHHDHQPRPKTVYSSSSINSARPQPMDHASCAATSLTHHPVSETETTTRLGWHMSLCAPAVWTRNDRPSRWWEQHPHALSNLNLGWEVIRDARAN